MEFFRSLGIDPENLETIDLSTPTLEVTTPCLAEINLRLWMIHLPIFRLNGELDMLGKL